MLPIGRPASFLLGLQLHLLVMMIVCSDFASAANVSCNAIHVQNRARYSPEDRCPMPSYQASAAGLQVRVQVEGQDNTILITNGADLGTTNITVVVNRTVRVLLKCGSLSAGLLYRLFTYLGVFRENGILSEYFSEYFTQCNELTRSDSYASITLPDFDIPGRYYVQLGHDFIDSEGCILTAAFWIHVILPHPTTPSLSELPSSPTAAHTELELTVGLSVASVLVFGALLVVSIVFRAKLTSYLRGKVENE